MNNKLSELKAAALAATPGPWIITNENTRWNIEDASGEQVAISQQRTPTHKNPKQTDRTANAIFIAAANPNVILALLAELEAKDKRIAELELDELAMRASSRAVHEAQENHINQQQDRIESLEKTNAGLGRRLGDAEKRLGTPVRFPNPCAFNLCDLVDRDAVIASLREQGFTAEGGE